MSDTMNDKELVEAFSDVRNLIDRARNELADASSYADAAIKRIEGGYNGTLYRTAYSVKGRGAFPIDMLRYTSSYPADEDTARRIERSFEDDTEQTYFLKKYHRDDEPQLARERWEAKFRWSIIDIEETVAC